MNIPDDRLFITVAEAAEILMADERTVRRGIERGELPGIKVGSTIRIPWDKFKRVTGLQPAPITQEAWLGCSNPVVWTKDQPEEQK